MSHELFTGVEGVVVEVTEADVGDTVVTALDNSTTVTVEDPRTSSALTETTITVEEFYDLQVLTVDEPGYGGGAEALGTGEFKFLFTLLPSHISLETTPGVISVPIVSSYSGPIIGVSDVYCFIDGRRMSQNRGWRLSTDGLFLEIYLPTEEPMRSAYLNSELEYVLVWSF